jgi:hypothetical protein
MITRNLGKVQEALTALNSVQRNLNELMYYKKELNSENHSSSQCSSVRSTIDTLVAQHSEVVSALIIYGTEYQGVDARLAASNNPDYQSTRVCLDFSYVNAPIHKKGFWERTWSQIILGDFSDDATWIGSAVSIVASFFGVDAPMDVRDFSANVSKGEWGWAVVSAVSLLPIIGIFGKGGKAVAKGAKATDTAVDIIDASSKTIKQGNNIIDISSDIKYLPSVNDGSKLGGKYSDVFVQGEGFLFQVHHMPANSSSIVPFKLGPGIKMDIFDHKITASFDNLPGAKLFRETQSELIKSGSFRKAIQMDIDDIRLKFGDKYDQHISEMLKYVDELVGRE